MNLRQITYKDQLELRKVYFDSIKSIEKQSYSPEQIRAWSSKAWDNNNLNNSIVKGKGWLINEKETIIAFGLRYPKNRLSLLYCLGKHQRKGLGTKLLYKIEEEAKEEGLEYIYTEASLLSYRLLLKLDWEILRKEKIIINNIFFERYKMIKIF